MASIEVTGTFVPRESGEHTFGTRGLGAFALAVDGETRWEGVQAMGNEADPFEAFFGAPSERARIDLTEGRAVEVSLTFQVPDTSTLPLKAIMFSLLHLGPRRDADELIAEAVAAARAADTAVVVVATTERVESEGFDRRDLALPGRQDDLVRAVATANPNTVVVVNAGSPVELPWRDEVAAVLLTWFPGQEGGAALADVLLGHAEPGGRLPTTWPARFADAPVTEVIPTVGRLEYTEGLFIGYRAYEQQGIAPAFPFGHGLGYTDWAYESLEVTATTARVRVTNTGSRPAARSSRSTSPPPPRPTPRSVRRAGWPRSRASRRAPARASRPRSPCPPGPSRSGTRKPAAGSGSAVRTRSARATPTATRG